MMCCASQSNTQVNQSEQSGGLVNLNPILVEENYDNLQVEQVDSGIEIKKNKK